MDQFNSVVIQFFHVVVEQNVIGKYIQESGPLSNINIVIVIALNWNYIFDVLIRNSNGSRPISSDKINEKRKLNSGQSMETKNNMFPYRSCAIIIIWTKMKWKIVCRIELNKNSKTYLEFAGYGSLTPRTVEGKIVTMAYAMIGVPLMLMCLSNLGRVLAESVRQTYARLCIRQQLPHRYAAEDDDDDDAEHEVYNGTQQYQPVPQKNEVTRSHFSSSPTKSKFQILNQIYRKYNLFSKQKQKTSQECNLCQYNVYKETRTCNSNERSGKFPVKFVH